MTQTDIAQQICAVLDREGRVCGQRLTYEDGFPEGRCPRHCRELMETGELCGMVVMSNGYCYKHGGAAVSSNGKMSPYWEGSALARERAQTLPPKLAEIYGLSVVDDDLLSHRPDLALVEARIQELLSEVDAVASERMLRELKTQLNQFQKEVKKVSSALRRSVIAEDKQAIVLDHVDELQGTLDMQDIMNLVDLGLGNYSTWAEIVTLIDKRRFLTREERQRLEQQKRLITSERAMAVIAAVSEKIAEVINRHVDPKQARVINSEIGASIREIVGYES